MICFLHAIHDIYVGQQTAQSSIKLHTQSNTCMPCSFLALYWVYCWSFYCNDYRKVLTYLSFALNQGWHKDCHLVCVWQWKTPDSSVTHIEAKRSFSYIQFHSTERNLLLSKFDTSSCGAVLQSIAWCAPLAQSEFKPRLTVSADRRPFLKTSPLVCLTRYGIPVSADVYNFFFFWAVNWLDNRFLFNKCDKSPHKSFKMKNWTKRAYGSFNMVLVKSVLVLESLSLESNMHLNHCSTYEPSE